MALGVACAAPAAPAVPTGPATTAAPQSAPKPPPTTSASEPPASLTEAARNEGTVVLYLSLDAAAQSELATQFKERYGVTADFAQVPPAQIIERTLLEHDSGRVNVDLVGHSSAPAMKELAGKGGLANVSATEAPSLAQTSDVWQGTYGSYGGPAYVLGWNKNLVSDSEVPKTWCELADPKWKGKIAANDSSGAGHIWANWRLMTQACGDDFLPKMSQQNIRWFATTSQIGPALASGEVAISPAAMPHILEPLKAKGASVEWHTMETMSIAARYIGALKNAPHPNAARLFLHFLYSEQAQKSLYAGKRGVAALRSVPDQIQPPVTFEIVDSGDYPPEVEQRIRKALGL
jgi:iron(III) transport system substrate-binding protein